MPFYSKVFLYNGFTGWILWKKILKYSLGWKMFIRDWYLWKEGKGTANWTEGESRTLMHDQQDLSLKQAGILGMKISHQNCLNWIEIRGVYVTSVKLSNQMCTVTGRARRKWGNPLQVKQNRQKMTAGGPLLTMLPTAGQGVFLKEDLSSPSQHQQLMEYYDNEQLITPWNMGKYYKHHVSWGGKNGLILFI